MPTLYSMVIETGNRNRTLERCKFRFCLVHWIDPRSIEHNNACCLSNALDRPSNKHNCVLSNAGLSNALTKSGICTSLKSGFYYRFHSLSNTKSALPNFICTWDLVWSVERCAHQSLKTAEIRIRTPLKSASCFRLVSQIGVDATTFLSRLQNLVKIGKELRT